MVVNLAHGFSNKKSNNLIKTFFKFVILVFLIIYIKLSSANEVIIVGSKRFSESYIISEIISQVIKKNSKIKVFEKKGLGNTGILFAALKQGDIDIYPEYTGTIIREILKEDTHMSIAQINKKLKKFDLTVGIPLGFNNSYTLALKKSTAEKLNIKSISDIARNPEIKIGLSHEFLSRSDGWQKLREKYNLNKILAIGIDHSFAYKAIEKNQVDIIDAYSTDANLLNSEIITLDDDKKFFPSYKSILIYRSSLNESHPEFIKTIKTLKNKISNAQMQKMNYDLEINKLSLDVIAKTFLSGSSNMEVKNESFMEILFHKNFLILTFQHIFLVFFSIFLAMTIGIPIGILSFCFPKIGKYILNLTGLLQTIPSLALLAFLIFIFNRIGIIPAIIAIFLYSLLPIVENTNLGLKRVNKQLKEAAIALGASFWICLFKIEIKESIPAIFSGIKIAAITSTGTATIAAFIGAGGYGERINQGLAVNNNEIMLSGAIPAAVFAILLQYLLDFTQKKLLVCDTNF